MPRVAAFDWDNTVIKNDIGYGMLFYLLRHDLVLQPPERDWRRVSRYLSDAAVAALSAACGPLAAPGRPLPTATNGACADEILSLYQDETTRDGRPGFSGTWNHRLMQPAYAFGVQLLAGRTPGEVRRHAAAAIREYLAAPVGATLTVGTRRGLPGYIRIYEPMRALIAALERRGVTVWIISASPQQVVETFAPRVGVPAERVIGVRLIVDAQGRLTPRLLGCGGVPEGDGIIPYKDGKRCFLNQVVFGLTGPPALLRHPRLHPLFAAGDADTDVTFLRDAELRLVIWRGYPELSCHALSGRGWLVRPMFIDPLPQRTTPYPCASTACTAPDGARVPCRDEAGRIIPDQVERNGPPDPE